MSNRVYDDKLYNSDHKDMYLSQIESSASKTIYERILKRAAFIEEQVSKDLYNFNIEEVEKLLFFLAPTTFSSSSDALYHINQYINWGIQQGLRTDNINPLLGIRNDENYVRKFIDQTNKYYFTEAEINDMINRIMNFQDSGIIQCLYEGMWGHQYSEILSLVKSDIHRNSNVIEVRNLLSNGDTERRSIKVSSKLMNMLYSASEETEYTRNNGDFSPTLRTSKEIKLVENEYVFRNGDMNTKEYGIAPSHLITRRLKNISRWFDYTHLKAMNIRKSGMIKMARDLIQISNKFEREEISEIFNQFNIDYTSTTRITKDFLNIETIRALYPEE
ncbi:hypothetical protein D3C73_278560 [compost metagenome]